MANAEANLVAQIRDELISEGHVVHEQVPCGEYYVDLMTDRALYYIAATLDAWRLEAAMEQLIACREAFKARMQLVVVAGSVVGDISAGLEQAGTRDIEVVILNA